MTKRPVPESVSPEARAFLAEEPSTRPPYPLLHDLDGWRRHVGRMESELAPRLVGLDAGVDIESATIGGVPVWRADPKEHRSNSEFVYLDIHGGALIIGGGEVCRLMAAATAHATGLPVWSVDYRMPPDDPYPAGLDD